jgi:SAM-dependent methyltransferase
VVDIDADNRSATIIGDLCDPATLAPESFDCVILTQTLHLIPDRDAALASAWQSVRPGGALILTAPSIVRVDTETPETDCVRFTPVGLRAWLEQGCPSAEIHVEGAGNLVTAVAALLGLAEEDVPEANIVKADPNYPVVVGAIARKPLSS